MEIQTRRFDLVGETVESARLENGLKVVVVPKKGFSGYAACFGTWYGALMRRFELGGVLHTTPAGVAHYLEHKMFDMPDGENALQRMTADGADPNAFTDYDETVYHFRCTENFYDNLRELLRFVSTPHFTAQTVEKERGIIAQEIRMYDDDPDDAVYQQLLRLLYRSHALRDDIAGTVESIAEITPEILYDCHGAFYVPGNMCLCAVGDVEIERVCALADELLGREERPMPRALLDEEQSAPEKLYAERIMSVSQPLFTMGAAFVPAEGTEALRERITSRLALRLLCGRSTPLYARLYGKGLINRSFSASAGFNGNTAVLSFGGESRDPSAVYEALLTEIERVAAEGFDPADFERARRATIGAQLRGYEDLFGLCVGSFNAAREDRYVFDAAELIREIRAEDCRALLSRVLVRDRTALSVVKAKQT